MSMVWTFSDRTTFDISGSTGEFRVPPRASDTDKLQKYNGKMGLPGKPGGIFVGVASVFSRPNLLTIVSNGGMGGKGQDGGNGMKTYHPTGFFNPSIFQGTAGFTTWCSNNYYDCRLNSRTVQDLTIYDTYVVYTLWMVREQIPADGGKRGHGGYAGKIELTNLNQPNNIVKHLTNGAIGDYGRGGEGKENSSFTLGCSMYVQSGSIYTCAYIQREHVTILPGKDDISELDKILPQHRPNPFNTLSDLLHYKFQLLLKPYLPNSELSIISLTNNTNILNLYNVQAFLTEVMMIEKMKDTISPELFNVYINTLLTVIKSWKTSSYDEEQAMVFASSTLSAIIFRTEMYKRSVSLHDLHTYIKSALPLIDNLNTINIIKVSDLMTFSYSESMDTNIIETHTALAKCMNECEQTFQNIRKTNGQIVDEIMNINISNIELRMTKKIELRDQLMRYEVIETIYSAAQFLSVLGASGTSIRMALGPVSLKRKEHLIFGDGKNPGNISQGVDKILINLEKLKKGSWEGHIEVVIYSCVSFLSIPGITESDKSKISEIRQFVSASTLIRDVHNSGNLFMKFVKQLQSMFEKIKPGDDMGLKILIDNNLSILDYADSVSPIPRPIIDGIKEFKIDQKKLQILICMFKKVTVAHKYFSELHDAVHEVIRSMLSVLLEDMLKLKKELVNSSDLSVIIKKWDVPRHIKKLSSTINRYTQRLQNQEELNRYNEQVNEISLAVVSLFQQIQSYQEHLLFAGYIGDLQKVGGGVIPDSSKFRNELHALKKAIISNLVRAQCIMIVTSFKREIFPLSNLHVSSLAGANGKNCEGDDYLLIKTIKTVQTQLDKIPKHNLF